MPTHLPRTRLAVIGAALLLVVILAGCGRRGVPAAAGVDGAAATHAAATTGPTSRPTTPTTRPTTDVSVPPASAAATEPPVTSVPVTSAPVASLPPLATPDLAAIEDLLRELDAALGADATADTDEGSPK